ncbi:hypothetical protein AVCANL279_07360 [Campylobacter canadensis]|uniref:hypothetical protein n=1 Tax=Campylobacter canadensis TaxID=449520 RepID=UPI001554A33D|nr:hypothetical protein [Campylobacter canadensis]MBZ7995167.1 hypothetical protein [Campylobacter canadensis]MBZ7997136.1 hypothetical protein [Campylobacter canadensis]MBZ8000531.1 hypothetical protein [Campylobacter canadensis]MBZ8003842.1 hypothetical protein [Campylobacter canadensis]
MNDTYTDFTKKFFGSKMPKTTNNYQFDNFYDSLGYSPIGDNNNSLFGINNLSNQANLKNNNLSNQANANSGFFGSKAFSNAIGAVGAVGGLIGGVGTFLAAREQKKYNKKILALEEQQRNRIMAREDSNNKALNDGLNDFFNKQKK